MDRNRFVAICVSILFIVFFASMISMVVMYFYHIFTTDISYWENVKWLYDKCWPIMVYDALYLIILGYLMHKY